ALREIGYEATMPEGTFYVMARSPMADDEAFTEVLARHRVLVLPGTIVEVPGWFRISLTASDEMVEHAIPRFAAAISEARGQEVPSREGSGARRADLHRAHRFPARDPRLSSRAPAAPARTRRQTRRSRRACASHAQ